MRWTGGRIVGYVLFGAAVVVVLRVMDGAAYRRAERLYDRVERVARSGRSEAGFEVRRAGDARVVVVSGVQADMCNAFTGGLWFGFLMPRLSSVRDLHPDVRSRSGFCARSGTNTLLFRFEGAGGVDGQRPPGASRGSAGDGIASTAPGGSAVGVRLSGGLS
ncbi:MAG: hypothetical protein Q8W51_07945 [Candidatus Palauibacterales bacterium]|nr:hypothetical protein [Candidatus Palauibacterales bacterium]MDP2529655.1 hypothetical protein [Candidatus Palauibacterales bacterium]MDP2584406.1 hypothetical protein [Candidatus Palauibacterales bacterium]